MIPIQLTNLIVCPSFDQGPVCKVGRHVENDIPFPGDKSVSRNHVEIQIDHDNITIVDLSSRFGTHIASLDRDNLEYTSISGRQDIKSGQVVKFGAVNSLIRFIKKHI